jgi:hypothetical protein
MRSKLSPDAQQILLDAGANPKGTLNVMGAVHGQLRRRERERLRELGCRVRSVAGDVFTAELPAAALEAVTDLDFIRYIELSRPLRPELSK